MTNSIQPTFIFDFDSTIIRVEALEELSKISLKNSPDKEKISAKVAELTDKAMTGKLSFAKALAERVKILEIEQKHLDILVPQLTKLISPSFLRNKEFFKANRDRIYVVTGGFKEYAAPVVEKLGLKKENVFANEFLFSSTGKVTGVNTALPLSQDGGKIDVAKSLKKQQLVVVGDGFTDYEIKKALPTTTSFVCYVENVYRAEVAANADKIVSSIDEFLFEFGLTGRFSFPKKKLKVLLLENVHSRAIQKFEDEGFDVKLYKGALESENLLKELRDTSILGVRSKTDLTSTILANAPRLLTVGAFCIGTNNIALDHCRKRGIPVFNAPYSNTRSVVELAVANIIALWRKLTLVDGDMHKGKWSKLANGCREIRGKTLGLVGYGNIGSQLSVVAEALGMRVLFFDVREKLALGNAKRVKSMKELFQKSDVISIHVDGRQSNKNLISTKEFAMMKKGVLFLNLSRGHIVDIDALQKAVTSGQVAGAALDVYPYEPKDNAEPFKSPLQNLPNVILTPHIGGSTEEAQENIGEYVADKLLEFINNGGTQGSVNFPEVEVPQLKGAHRLLHTHHNVPGILAQINNSLAESKINILGQQLKTLDDVGYVIIDVNKKQSDKVIKSLRAISDTIKLRVLY